MQLQRRLDLSTDINSRSVFLFGPRQTGKTTWLRQLYPRSRWYNLLHGDVFLRLSRTPGRFRQELAGVTPAEGPVIVDEIQKLPSLLDDIHALIEEQGLRFILTGSSPVKLRRSGINLLGGRARIRYMMPFVSAEVPDWSLDRAIRFGGIPSVYLSDDPVQDLLAYCGAYLQLEVAAEGLVRGIEPFSRFLQVAARCATQQIVFEQIASEAQVPARTVREYYQVLVDTLVGVVLEPAQLSGKTGRKPVSHGKFYLFDNGVAHALAGTIHTAPTGDRYGPALEHLVFTELRAWLSLRHDPRPLRFWRTTDGMEVDFVIGTELAIEIKGSTNLGPRDFRGLVAIQTVQRFARRVVVCHEPVHRVVDGIDVYPVREFLLLLWADEFLDKASVTPDR